VAINAETIAIGKIVRARRKALGLNQTQLGLKAFPGLEESSAQSKIKRIELGQIPKAHELEILANALNLETEELIPGMKEDHGLMVSEKVLDKLPRLRNVLVILNELADLDEDAMMEEVVKSLLKAKDLKQRRA
jgi:transcriptional regulator with XRE-family HTH domain